MIRTCKILKTLLPLLLMFFFLNIAWAQTDTMHNCQPVWKYAVTGSGIGLNTLQSRDYDGDGNLELIIGSHSREDYRCDYWYKLEYDPEKEDFIQIWVSKYYDYENDNPSVIESFDADNDGLDELVVGYTNSIFEIIDPVSMQVEHSVKIPSWDDETIFRIIRADADNDNEEEIACCTKNATYFFNPGSYTSDGKIWYGAKDMRCGNVDSIAGAELVYGDGSVVCYKNGQAQLLWDFTTTPDTYRKPVKLYDLDSDGRLEIMYLDEYDLTVFDATLKAQEFKIEGSYDIDEVIIADTYLGNGPEIIVGEDNRISFYTLNGVFDREFRNWELSGVAGMNIVDFNNDGSYDLVFASGIGSSASDGIKIYNFQTEELIYESKVFEGPIWGFKVADVDSDGVNEFIFLNDDYEPSITYINSADKKVVFSAKVKGAGISYGFRGYDIADFDYDGIQEIVQLTSDYSTNTITALNALTYEIESVLPISQQHDAMSTIKIADCDQDGMQEFITANDDYLYIIDPLTGSIKWTSPDELATPGSYSGTEMYIEVANVDADPNLELIWYCGYKAYVFDGFTKQVDFSIDQIYDISLFDLDKDGINEIFYSGFNTWEIGGQTGYIDRTTGDKIVLANQYFANIAVFEIPGRTSPVIAGLSRGQLVMMTLDGKGITEKLDISSDYMDYHDNRIHVTDYNNDGVSEILINTYESLNEFDVTCYLQLSMDELKSWDITDIKLWPNPSNGIIYFGTDGLQGEGAIYNLQGQHVMSLPSGIFSANITSLPNGMYILKVITNNQQLNSRFIKD